MLSEQLGVTRHVPLGTRIRCQDRRISAWSLQKSVIWEHPEGNRGIVSLKVDSKFSFAYAEICRSGWHSGFGFIAPAKAEFSESFRLVTMSWPVSANWSWCDLTCRV